MRKIFLLLTAMVVSIAANATDFWLIGGPLGWGLENPAGLFTDKGNGIYELEYKGTLSSGFKINDGSWSGKYNLGSADANATLSIGQTFNLINDGNSKDINMSTNIENPTLTLDINALTLTITGKAVEAKKSYDIWGSLASDKWTAIDLNENEGKWEAKDVTVIAGNFGIRQKDAATGSQTAWISSAAGAAVVLDTPMATKVNGTNWTIAAGTYSFSFDPEAMTLTVTGKSEGGEPVIPTPDYSGWYVNILGDFNSWGSNGKQPNAENISTHTNLPIGTSGFKVKIWNGTDDVYYSNGAALAVGEWTKIEGNAEANMTIAGATEGELYNVEWNCATSEIRVTKVESIDYTTWKVSVLGDFNEWGAEGIAANEEGIAKICNLEIGEKTFKIKVDNGSESWYSNGTALTAGEWIAVPGNTEANMSVAGAKADSKYDIEWNCKTNEIRVTATQQSGVDAIDAIDAQAEYFDLNGIRVINPENGLYIRRQGDNVTKVIIRR